MQGPPTFSNFTNVRFRSLYEQLEHLIANYSILQEASQFFPIIENLSWPFIHSFWTVFKHSFSMLRFCDKKSDICSGEYFNSLSFVTRKLAEPNSNEELYKYVPEIKQALFLSIMEQLSSSTIQKGEIKKNKVPLRMTPKECAGVWLFPPHQ